MGNANQPVSLKPLRADADAVIIEGDLYRMAERVQGQLAAPEADGVDYVVRLAISLIHQAIGKTITFTDPGTGESEEYRLWRS